MRDEDAIGRLAALAHQDRLATFRLLVKAGPEGLPSGRIAEKLTIPPTRMSFHLAALERAGLLTTRRDGRRIVYAVAYGEMRNLLEFLTEDCCGGHPEICSTPGRMVPRNRTERT
ncbi:helix-turn-helix transcriptional regulator [Roseibium sp. RKSG952]|uniref:ArsR/SmtB family transcription factor n=1 Tax=Roseibium sp. RKSG952 TaxID=2529384 RepID=UPI0012BD7B25|nr:metalloregulator ArsR/SmtB family transcription factor [Roseibium sp. RKSG952]MTH97947.1 transcriptional regulator [Roseibium sp. RKSG952]